MTVESSGKKTAEKNCGPQTGTIVLELTDERNALERVLLHFANLKKRTEKTGEGKYRVEIDFDRSDETEMVIRLLQFGPVLRVVGPKSIVAEIRRRLGVQMWLRKQCICSAR